MSQCVATCATSYQMPITSALVSSWNLINLSGTESFGCASLRSAFFFPPFLEPFFFDPFFFPYVRNTEVCVCVFTWSMTRVATAAGYSGAESFF